MNRKDEEALSMWKDRLSESDAAYKGEIARFDEREEIYQGRDRLEPLTENDRDDDGSLLRTPHQRRVAFELIESQVSTAIPQPHVTARRKQDELLAEKIEHLLRNEIDRLPFEKMNDLAERIVPIQGAAGILVEWDNDIYNGESVGDLNVSIIHPKRIAPQPGVNDIEEMNWFIIKTPTTKSAVYRRYGIYPEHETEEEPEMRGNPQTQAIPETRDAVTVYVGYERTDAGTISRFAWCSDIVLENLENYQARRQPVCKNCGHTKPFDGQIVQAVVPDNMTPEMGAQREQVFSSRGIGEQMAGAASLSELPVGEPEEPETKEYHGGACPFCGSDEWTESESEYEQVLVPIMTKSGVTVEGLHPGTDKDGFPAMVPTLIPYYRPDRFPLTLWKSVSTFGRLYGTSDIDMIADQQNTINRLEKKIIDRIVKAGTRITLPPDDRYTVDTKDSEAIHIENPSDLSLINTFQFEGNLTSEFAYMGSVYEEARQTLGITNSFQGREDTTAKSGIAKQFSAAQSAGRLESKRMMKHASFADMYESMFLFWLAYADEPRTLSFKGIDGETRYEEISRYDFLVNDGGGRYHWNTDFLFSCDSADTLAANREAMWQETRVNLQSGAFGNPQELDTLILFWRKMEALHYPEAGQTRQYLEDKLKRQQEQAQEQMQMQMAMQAAQARQAAQEQRAQEQAAQPQTATQEAMAERGTPINQTTRPDAGL